MVSSDLSMQDVEASIASVIEPLKAQLGLVEGKERLLLDELESTRAMKAKLLSTLRKLDPTMSGPGRKPGKKPTSSNGRGLPSEAVLATVRLAVDKVAPKNPDGFTRARIGEQLKADGIAMGDNRQKEAMAELHTSGYLTLHKIVTGGNKSYKRTEDLDDSARHAV